MNKDQIKGKAKEIAGDLQEKAGRVVGSKEMEAKGHAKEQAGKAQKKMGDVKEAVTDAKDAMKRKM